MKQAAKHVEAVKTRVASKYLAGKKFRGTAKEGEALAAVFINEAKEKSITRLKLRGLNLKHVPPEIGELTKLELLSLGSNRLQTLQPEIGQLTELHELLVEANQLSSLPPELGRLVKLKTLALYGNVLDSLPQEIASLQELRLLGLSGNQFSELPIVVFQLKQLRKLRLSANKLNILQPEISLLSELEDLRLGNNRLKKLPTEIGQLKKLQKFILRRNELTVLPAEIGNLLELRELDLRWNPIASLPVELGRCSNLKTFLLPNQETLRFPPADVSELGGDAILRFLRAADQGSEQVWESKLLLVGEGAVGKTWLYEALNDRRSGGDRKDEGATVGIEIGPLVVTSDDAPDVPMRLNCWDFAGQDINHATHQFFFSQRTLFLLCWNARAGWEAGKLRKWLTNIRDRAPGAIVILVATHSDQPHSDYPEKELRNEFNQIKAAFKVSSETGDGIDELKREIALQAKKLPMMGLRWPKAWRAAQQAVQALRSKSPYADIRIVRETICSSGLDDTDASVLLRWLHELGEVLHYADVPELAEIVMLNPQWVTRHVGEVLASSDVQKSKGVLTNKCLEQIWPQVESHVRRHLLGMMERFDLAYRIPEDQEHRCLVVERLPQNPPDYEARWKSAAKQAQVSLRYRLKAMHPGIPTWFIARCHRFTLGLHWLRGVVFGDNRAMPRHLALVTASDSERTVTFNVRGPQPWTFLPLLTDGFEDTILKRYPGLQFDRIAPCPGRRRDGSQCDYEFDVKDLEALRWPQERNVAPEFEIRCTRCRTTFDIDNILLGLSRAPARDTEKLQEILDAVHVEGQQTRAHFSQEMVAARQFIQLAFVQEWNKAQELEEHSCPTVFALYPVGGKTLTRKNKLHLQLYCMHPGCWHSIGESGVCEFQPRRAEFIIAARWVRTGLRWLRPAAALLPSGSQLAGEYAKGLHEYAQHAENELKFTADVFKELKDIPNFRADESGELELDLRPSEQTEKLELHELKAFLDCLDFPVKPFGGLKRVRTPEGHILWLCAEHAAEFGRSF